MDFLLSYFQSSNILGAAGAIELAKEFHQLDRLEEFSLVGRYLPSLHVYFECCCLYFMQCLNGIGAEGAAALAKVLKDMQTIQILEMVSIGALLLRVKGSVRIGNGFDFV